VTSGGDNTYEAQSVSSGLPVSRLISILMRRIGVQGKVDIFARSFKFRLLFSAGIVILASACGRSDNQIKVYRQVKAPLESPPREQTAATNAAAATPQIKWEVPEGWAPGSPSPLRYASFVATGEDGEKTDISVVTFPGDGGSDLDNVNRWRQQVGLAAVDESDLSSTVAHLENSGLGSTCWVLGYSVVTKHNADPSEHYPGSTRYRPVHFVTN
jgi:hypothetical protein